MLDLLQRSKHKTNTCVGCCLIPGLVIEKQKNMGKTVPVLRAELSESVRSSREAMPEMAIGLFPDAAGPAMMLQQLLLVGGLVAIFYFPIYWVSNHPN